MFDKTQNKRTMPQGGNGAVTWRKSPDNVLTTTATTPNPSYSWEAKPGTIGPMDLDQAQKEGLCHFVEGNICQDICTQLRTRPRWPTK